MARFLTALINEDIDERYSRLKEPFGAYLETLKERVEAPAGFVHDYESVPVVKGTSKRGGVIHDYLSRSDSVPVVTKAQAAAAYFEIMESRDALEGRPWYRRLEFWARRWIKWGVVRVAWGYFHKFRVAATYEEISGRREKCLTGS
jgi:hypothetical protein